MNIIDIFDGKKYTKSTLIAEWKIILKTGVYEHPFTASKKLRTMYANEYTYTSLYKSTVDKIDWYYLPNLKGWMPWKYSSVQRLKKVGKISYDQANIADGISKAVPSISKVIPNINTIIDTDSDEHKNFLRSNMLLKEDGKKWNNKFNRLQFVNPYHAIGNTREYLFFTKFDLHIMDPHSGTLNKELGNEPFWLEMAQKYNSIIAQLQLSFKSNSMPFMPILHNSIASSLDLPSVSAETTETGQTIYGTTIQYRQGSFKSDENYDFSLEFYDNPWLETYHFFKMYNEYENLKSLGVVTPPSYYTSQGGASNKLNKYIVDKILHDQIGIYKIIVDDDMETIIHYSYMCGCFPKSVPRETFKDIESGLIRYSIDWHAQFVEDMNPMILSDFDQLCGKYINPTKDILKPLWDKKNGRIDGNWIDCPYILKEKDTSRPTGYRYKLKWFNKK